MAAAERYGFALVDIRVTYERALDDLATALSARLAGIREARPEDVERLKQITGRNFADSRFYADPHFQPSQCDALYATWIERSFNGYADRVLVAERNGTVVGYVTCNLADRTGNIGLIAVDAAARGEGVGRRLVISALHYFREQGMTGTTVVTQARNIGSQRLVSALWFPAAIHRAVVSPLVRRVTRSYMSYRIPFNRPGLTGNEMRYMSDVIARGHAAGDGEYTKRCHKILQDSLGVPRALLTTSCTHALEMAALLLRLEPGDEVIVPSFTFVSTANAFVLRGAKAGLQRHPARTP